MKIAANIVNNPKLIFSQINSSNANNEAKIPVTANIIRYWMMVEIFMIRNNGNIMLKNMFNPNETTPADQNILASTLVSS